MGQPIPITVDNFHEKLKQAVTTDGTLRGQVQRLIIFGMIEYDQNRNSNWLSEVMNAGFRSVRMAAVQEYIQDHTDLVWTKKKDGTTVFLREAKEGFKFSLPTETWYEYSNKGNAIPVANPDTMLKTIKGYITKLENGLKGEGATLQGSEESAKALLAKLNTVVA